MIKPWSYIRWTDHDPRPIFDRQGHGWIRAEDPRDNMIYRRDGDDLIHRTPADDDPFSVGNLPPHPEAWDLYDAEGADR